MTSAQHAAPKTAKKKDDQRRQKPGTTGHGRYYHIEIRPADEFTTFRTQDVGEKGGIQRVAGQREDGAWETQKWLISKDMAHVEKGRLIPDAPDAREVLQGLREAPVQIEGDRFQAKPSDTK